MSSVGSQFSKVSSFNLHLLGRRLDWFFTGNFNCLLFNLLAHSSCIFFVRILHRKFLLFPCPGCSTALLPLAVFHSRFSPFRCFSPGNHFLATLSCRFHANKTGKYLELCRGGFVYNQAMRKAWKLCFHCSECPRWLLHEFLAPWVH